ncbi:MAG: A-factor type gamma-butyrolactone 1'-reductase (1S-forming) [Chroococcidiopsis sp. SAG 2025]|uniref:glucose 1-dehydrogenase n=1 Tax=Chroococcidiopsis sp. SAG 2025 TaxID=171389 RepID=UPI002936F303|nr:glucose 1-dehydrogenase [Chroococcidiopsis sp. SAG 2025]MDV2994492.1 A-factor type gamma-butyrolactone 1'-reductase (1S-forming) [Chroococcidiopsis sp. SAG 2025]
MNFQRDKVALVTGGSSGIGRAAALQFAKQGAKVVVAARRETAGNQTVEQIRQLGKEASFVQTDVSQPAEIEALIQKTIALYGQLDYAFNNAGTEGVFAPMTQLTEANWDRTITTNLKAVWLCLKYEIEQMIAQVTGGAIVNTSSWLAKGGLLGTTIYSASKGGLDGMVRAAALECAKAGIRVNNVNPGIIDTEMFRRFGNPDDPNDAVVQAFTHHIPLKRLGSSEEVAEAVVWLCSDAATYITGETISVDGGSAIPGSRN